MDNFYPNGKASTARVRCYGKGFINHGVKTSVLLPRPRFRHCEKNLNPEKEGIDKYGIYYRNMAGTSQRSNNVVIRKIVDLYGSIVTLFYLLIHLKKEDKVVLYEGGCTWFLLTIFVCHLKGVQVGMELNELPFATGIENKIREKRRKRMLNNVFPHFDFFFVISESLSHLAKQYAPRAKVLKVPIIVESQLTGDDFPVQPIPYLFHSGSLFEQKDGICGMIEAFGIACSELDQSIEYVFTGNLEDSPHAEEIGKIIRKYNIGDRVRFVGYLSIKELRMYQKNCFATIINKYDTMQNKYCFSTKLGEYLSFSKPVITTTVGEANVYLKDNVNAFVVEPHRPELIAEKIVFAFKHPDIALKVGKKGHELTEREFNCDYQTSMILQNIKMN